MKKLLFFGLILGLFSLSSCEKDTVVPENEIPTEIKSYLDTHFSDYPLMGIVKNLDGIELTYDLTLEDGFFLQFDRYKNIEEIRGVLQIPDSAIPSKILSFVNQHYAGHYIITWEEDDQNQDVTLSNQTKLEFNKDGEFLRIED